MTVYLYIVMTEQTIAKQIYVHPSGQPPIVGVWLHNSTSMTVDGKSQMVLIETLMGFVNPVSREFAPPNLKEKIEKKKTEGAILTTDAITFIALAELARPGFSTLAANVINQSLSKR